MGNPDASNRTGLAPARVPLVAGLARIARRAKAFYDRHRTVTLFLLGLLVTDWLVGRSAALWEAHSPDDYAARVIGCRSRPQDVVFVGGSPVTEGIDPDQIIGVPWKGVRLARGYALGLPGGTTSDVYHAVLRSCPTPPRVLVYGITASDINDSRHEPHGPYSLMTWGDLAQWVRLRPDSAGWVTRHFVQGEVGKLSNLFRYRHGIRMWAATLADRLAPGCCPESAREANELRDHAAALRSGTGYAPMQGFVHGNYAAVKAAGGRPAPFPYLAKYRTGSHLRYLHRLADWCEAREVALVLVDMPTTADLEAMYPREFAEFRARLAEMERHRGLTVVRAVREAVGLTDAHFADLIHLNAAGAQSLSRWLRGKLEAAAPPG
jgi:DNA-binding transcriptional regulator YiaG